jgi:hypothetical protein
MIFTPLDNSICYIGSTFNRLHKRFEGHKNAFKYWLKDKTKKKYISIFKYFEKYGIQNFKIIKIKSYNVIRTNQKDHKHLHAYETLWISKIKNCCNILIPFNPLIKETRKESDKKYKDANKEKIKQTNKKYRDENKDKIKKYRDEHKEYYKKYRDEHKEYYKKYYKENEDKIKEKNKINYEKNEDKIKEKNKIKFTCKCGGKYTNDHKSRHFKSKKHIAFCEKI